MTRMSRNASGRRRAACHVQYLDASKRRALLPLLNQWPYSVFGISAKALSRTPKHSTAPRARLSAARDFYPTAARIEEAAGADNAVQRSSCRRWDSQSLGSSD